MSRKKRVLLVAENITLAQVVRLAVLGSGLSDDYEVHFASSSFEPLVFSGTRFVRHELYTLDKAVVFKAMESGKRLYEKRTLVRYVEAELALIDRVEPDVIVGDFRLSLSTSAELRGVPWATLINAYFSPYAVRDRFPVPDHPIIKVLGEATTEKYFSLAVPKVFKHFAAPVNAVRKRYGLPEIGSLLEVLTHAGSTLYPDDPLLTPVAGAPSHHRFLGPVNWSPRVAMPELPRGNIGAPLVYVTLGSSGKLDVLPLVVEALSTLPVQAVIATAGRTKLEGLPANIHAVPFVPGEQMAKRASLVISNGGSTTGYQALGAGTPVLGLPSNLDQFLTMQSIENAGAGLTVKARGVTTEAVRSGIRELLIEPRFKQAAAEIQGRFSRLNANAAFQAWLDETISTRARALAI